MGISKYIRFAVIVFVAIAAVNYWLNTKTYVVNYKDIEVIAKKYAGTTNVRKAFANIETVLRAKYKRHIIPKKDTQWIFVNSGGWMGSMYILHASLTEYILFFGTAVDTGGHSGRYWANISDTLLTGSYRQWSEGELESKMYKPGDTIIHSWGEATGLQWTAGTWMVEYGRGFIPSTLTFALADSVFGTTDIYTIYYTFRIYIKALVNEAVLCIEDSVLPFVGL